MEIVGLIPQSFVDWRGRMVAAVLTPGSNFKRAFSIHAESIFDDTLPKIPAKEVLEDIHKVSWTLKGVCVTGGEPTLNVDLPIFLKKIKLKGLPIKLDTNATNPEMMRKLIDRKVTDFLSVDVMAPLHTDIYSKLTGLSPRVCDPLLENIDKSIDMLLEEKADYELKTTFAPPLTEANVLEIGENLAGCKRFVLQQFNPKNCTDPEYLKYPKTKVDVLRTTAEKIEGPREVRILTEEHGEELVR